MFVLSSIPSGVEFWSVNRTSVYENSECFLKTKFVGKISNNNPVHFLGTNAYNAFESCW